MRASASDAESLVVVPTVERFVVLSNRDDSIVIGPLDERSVAESERDRLSQEQMRNWLSGGETQVGEPLKPPGYRVAPIAAPDPAVQRAELEAEQQSRRRDVESAPAELRANYERELDRVERELERAD